MKVGSRSAITVNESAYLHTRNQVSDEISLKIVVSILICFHQMYHLIYFLNTIYLEFTFNFEIITNKMYRK